jgi:isopentenyl phosphate kinase
VSDFVFLKLGGSLITDKRQETTAREDVIARLAREVKQALDAQDGLSLVMGHGSGSFGHYAARQSGFSHQKQMDWKGFFEVGAAAARLNRIVVDIFLSEGVPVFSVQPSASAFCRLGEIVRLDDGVIREVVGQGGVPVVYGDVSLDDAWGWTIISTEHILAHLSRTLKPRRIVLAGERAVYTGNPSEDPQARLIPEITPANFESVRAGLTGADGYDVTGGMLSKVAMMVDLVEGQPGLEIHLVSGLEPEGVLETLMSRSPPGGTVIHTGASGSDD